jgi:hypothetical protein
MAKKSPILPLDELAETLTGADYYIGPVGSDAHKLQNCYRLEISGTDLATLEVRRRLKVKLT